MDQSEAVAFAKAMRDAGVEQFEFDGLKCVLRAPEPPRLTALAEQLGELPLEERERLLKEGKRQLEADLYGAA